VGDHGHLDEAGYLYLSPRRLDMVLVGGENVYPAEVEGVLLTHPSVADAAVVGVADERRGNRVVALVVPAATDGLLDTDAVRAHCRRRLSSYAVPSRVVVVSGLPRDGAGKLRRRGLAALAGSAQGPVVS